MGQACYRDIFIKHGIARHNALTESPADITTPFHIEMIKTGWDALVAYIHYMGRSNDDQCRKDPVWCFNRFGRSRTVLEKEVGEESSRGKMPAGTKLFIGGWHDDYADEDYFIYYDVTVVKPDGTIRVLQYLTDDFPPTDCHTATLIGHDTIVIIGSIGYLGHRGHRAQVCVLDLNTMKCRMLRDTKGDDPGWIANHTAELMEDGKRILITVSVPKHVKMEEGCRPGRWTFDHTEASWTALPHSDEDAEAVRLNKRFLEGTKKRREEYDDFDRRIDILRKVDANNKETDRLLKKVTELQSEYSSAARQLAEDLAGLRSVKDAGERNREKVRLYRARKSRAEEREEIEGTLKEIKRLSDESSALMKGR
ncbi:hypothetical protein HDU88_008326 [Geranomyces variabilis]|nr:hypothetical protein HDU88_008326 [Geranomyces variabilis]